ncbi:hypothetical protein GCM10027277_44430 [Pseudoduganella ginsengisoli]|uniref:Peptidase n=1 Tax=Pseudoduganella ginsengisoli TaxID=1462440 RepID=A0A6L6Q1R9_9BURK|nr:S41 family peptidase [Pseudoduganella ginsengisoli]MTW03757.1 peptidase [Pseudoduganella ginsengisoli]
MTTFSRRVAPLILALCCNVPALAATETVAAATASTVSANAISAAERNEAIDTLVTDLTGNYVFPDVAEKMAASIRARQQRGEYDQVADGKAFAQLLEQHLREISHDKHIQIRYTPAPEAAARRGSAAPGASQASNAFGRRVNFGFEKFERLEPNIAYLELRGFVDPSGGAETVAAAMGMAANADALIIDLRRNGGGSPRMVALISSYLFDLERVHLNDLYWRDGNRTEQFWTNPDVAGQRLGSKKPVYILTSKATFSAAEEFSYNLKQLKRAVIVGEVTGGGANPGGGFKFSEHVGGFIPTGRAINPITHTNWEGTGVQPDVVVPADQALQTALSLATAAAPANQ